MKFLPTLSALTILLAASSSWAETKPQRVFNAETFTLSNGMEVVVVPNHRAPVVTHMVWYKVGAADEPQGDGVSGAAHFLEHLMFKGSKAVAPGEFSRLIRSLGGEDNAFTSWDFTAYFQSISKTYLPTVMALEADRMININPPAKDVETELPVIIEERRQRTDNDPRALFMEQLRAVMFNTSPYGIPIIGWRDEMPKLTWQHAHDYYKTWYAPNNAILIVSGDITAEQLKPLAEKYYGFIPSKPIPAHIRPAVPEFSAEQRLTLRHADIRQPALIRGWRVPSFQQNPEVSYNLQVLEELISSGSATRLYQALVVKQKLASSVDLSYDGDNRGDGSLWLYAEPVPGVTLEKLETAIEQEFSAIIKDGFTDEELAKAKTRLIDSAIYARDSVAGPAMIIGQAMSAGATLEDIETWPAKIQAVERSGVEDVMKTFLDPRTTTSKAVTGYMLPEKETP